MSLPRPGSGDDEVRKYGALIGIIAAIGTLIVVLIVWGSNGSDAEGSTCTETPAGRVPAAIICPGNATPENSKERDCIRVSTYRDASYWTCSDWRFRSGRADRPSFKATVLGWKPGDTIPLSAGRTFQIVRLRHDADELSRFGFAPTKTRCWSSRM